MARSLNEKLNLLTSQRRERILAEADRLQSEYMTLQEIRKAINLTQTQLANSLKIRQATVSNTEKQNDLLLSTLRSYIEAMGGRLLLTVEFPDRPPVILKVLGDTESFHEIGSKELSE